MRCTSRTSALIDVSRFMERSSMVRLLFRPKPAGGTGGEVILWCAGSSINECSLQGRCAWRAGRPPAHGSHNLEGGARVVACGWRAWGLSQVGPTSTRIMTGRRRCKLRDATISQLHDQSTYVARGLAQLVEIHSFCREACHPATAALLQRSCSNRGPGPSRAMRTL